MNESIEFIGQKLDNQIFHNYQVGKSLVGTLQRVLYELLYKKRLNIK